MLASQTDRLVALDIETTGLQAGIDKIVEIGCVEILDRKIGSTLRHFVCPPVRVTPGAQAVHGLTDAFLSGFPSIQTIWPDIMGFIDGAEVLIHNAQFDMAFLDSEVGGIPGSKITDTLKLAKQLRGPKRRASLDILCKEYGVKQLRGEFHGGLEDAHDLASVWIQMTVGQEGMDLSVPEEATVRPALTARPIVLAATADELAAHRVFMLKHGMEAF